MVARRSPKRRTTGAPEPWIRSRAWDIFYVLATPLLCLAAVAALSESLSSLDLWLGVMALGAMGHHFPGFLRAYSDPQLFRRFRTRFLLAPPLFFFAVLWFTREGLHGMILVAALWGIWHGMMQHYGFMRIYDAKLRRRDEAGARWDFVLCLCWFTALLLWSPGRLHNLLEGLYLSGLPQLPAQWVRALPSVATGLAVVASIGYLRRIARQRQAGRPPSVVKLALCAATFGFLLLAFVGMDDLLLGLAAWEIYHDIQYLAIVWIFNRRVTDAGGKSRPMRLLFRPGVPYIALYVLLCLCWGTAGFGHDWITSSDAKQLAFAFVLTSGLLHFYFDGFIWKVSEPETSAGLGLAQGRGDAGLGRPAPGGMSPLFRAAALRKHPAFQPVAYGLVVGLLYLVSPGALERGSLELTELLAESVPGSPEAALDHGVALRKKGRFAAAAERFEQALALDPGCLHANNELGILRNAEDRLDEAHRHFSRAQQTNRGYAPAWNNLAVLAARDGDAEHSESLLREALRRDPKLAPAWNNLAAVLTLQNRTAEATTALDRALELEPGHRESFANQQLLADTSLSPEELSRSLHLAVATRDRLPGPVSGRSCGGRSP
jgi:tetratricopeptide (TPR) repeat protein